MSLLIQPALQRPGKQGVFCCLLNEAPEKITHIGNAARSPFTNQIPDPCRWDAETASWDSC